MHFAYPPRKSSNPTAYKPRSTKLPNFRRIRLRTVALGALGLFVLFYLLTRARGRHSTYTSHKPSGNPPVVIVTVFDPEEASKAYIQTVKENRLAYAHKHGMALPLGRRSRAKC